jgi:2-oxoglutarate ferredoxin oxidoreductase subunit gamma
LNEFLKYEQAGLFTTIFKIIININNKNMKLNILLSGDGGQGVQLLSYVICHALLKRNLQVSHIPNYGLEQRGGVSLAFIKISDKEIMYPKFTHADILLIISDQARERTPQYICEDTIVIDKNDYDEELKIKNISPRNINIFFLNYVLKELKKHDLDIVEDVYNLLKEKLGKKDNWGDVDEIFNSNNS